MRWVGIDFSGDVEKWKATCRNSNVWIAELQADGRKDRLSSLRRVQELPGKEPPFERLVGFLQGDFAAAGIDAPFSVPAPYVDSHQQLLATTAALVDSPAPSLVGRNWSQPCSRGGRPQRRRSPCGRPKRSGKARA